jgi:hypothetical protein
VALDQAATVRDIYRKAIHTAFNRAVAETTRFGIADFTVGDLMDVAGEVLAAERSEIARVRPQF